MSDKLSNAGAARDLVAYSRPFNKPSQVVGTRRCPHSGSIR